MKRLTGQVVLTVVIAFSGAVTAISAEQPPAPLPGASSPINSRALVPDPGASAAVGVKRPPPVSPPTLPTLADPQQPGDAVVPQVSMPLQRGERKPVLVKPGASAVGGGVDDHNARCLATAAAPRSECGPSPAPTPTVGK